MKPEQADNPGLEPSKSQLKREARALLKLCRELVAMSPKALAALPIDPDLATELKLARSIRSNVARKRQVQFVAKKMRARDVSQLIEAMEAGKAEARQSAVRHQRAEAWRDRIIKLGDAAVSELLNSYRGDRAQALRQLARNARREAQQEKPPASARKLFRLLREMDAENNLPPPTAD